MPNQGKNPAPPLPSPRSAKQIQSKTVGSDTKGAIESVRINGVSVVGRVISPSKYKPPPQTGNAKNPALNRASKYKFPGACTWKIVLK